MAFTLINGSNDTKPKQRVSIDRIAYADACGYDLIAHPMETAEQQAAEDRRADTASKNFNRALRTNIRNLMDNAKLDFTYKSSKGDQHLAGMAFISMYDISRESITIEFSLSAAEYLVSRPITQFPKALFAVDKRYESAYAVGVYLASHYSMNRNVSAGT